MGNNLIRYSSGMPEYEVCDDRYFDNPSANEQKGFLWPKSARERLTRELDVYGIGGAYMAGTRCPTPARLIELAHDVTDIEPWEQRTIHELIVQLSPHECWEFLLSADASPRGFATLMRKCKVKRGILVNWINQYATDPNWRDDKMLTIAYGDKVLGSHPYDRERIAKLAHESSKTNSD